MSKFLKHTLIGILFSLGFTQIAFAKSIVCERRSLESNGFTNVSAAAGWMPEHIDITINKDTAILRKITPVGAKPVLYSRGLVLKEKENGRVSIRFTHGSNMGEMTVAFEKFIGKKATLGLRNKAGYKDLVPSPYHCEIKKKPRKKTNARKHIGTDPNEEIHLTSTTTDVIIDAKTGIAQMKSTSQWFEPIAFHTKDGHGLSVGILSFQNAPNQEKYYEDEFSLSEVQAEFTNDDGIGLKFNVKEIIRELPETDWYVLYLKSTTDYYAWFKLRFKYS